MMWRQIMVAAIPVFGFAAEVQAQSLQTNTASEQLQNSPELDTSLQRGVNVSKTLNPQPPTSTASQLTSPTLPVSGGAPNSDSSFTAGAFNVFPAFTNAVYFDDNVFALPRFRLGDWAFVVRPEFSFRSNGLENLDIAGNAYVEGRKYLTYSSEDQINGGASIGGTAALGPDAQIVGRAGYVHGHEDRGVSDIITERFNAPIGYDQAEAAIALNNRWGKLWTSIGLTGLYIHYDEATLTDGITLDQSYRSGNIERLPFRIGYVVAPLTSVFVEASGNRRDFGVDLYDSKGYRVVGGLLLEPGEGSRAKGEVYAGFQYQNYSGDMFRDLSTWTAGGSLAFLVTDQFTLAVEGRREAREASLSGGAFVYEDGVSVVESVGTIRGDYRINSNLVAGAGVSYIEDTYVGANRKDKAWSPVASFKYSITPKVTLGFDYRYVTFNSTGFAIPGYQRNVYLLSVNAQF